jgi:hypothetical protein
MRRFHAILVMIALLASPLALLARSTPDDPNMCCGTYCPMRGAHGSQHGKIICGLLSATARSCGCTMRSNQQPDYGLNTVMAPTMPSALARLNIPVSSRRAAIYYVEFSLSGSDAAPFHPPRS